MKGNKDDKIVRGHVAIDIINPCPFGRDIRKSAVDKIVKEWDSRALGTLTIAVVNGVLMLIDGNHRLAAIKIIDEYVAVYCEVHENLTLEEAADLYIKINQNRRQLVRYDIYKAGLISKDEKWLNIHQSLIDAGMEASKSSTHGNRISAISAIERIYEKYGIETLTDTLKFIHSTWSGDRTSKRAEFIYGIAYLINYTKNKFKPNGFTFDSLREKLASEPAIKLIGVFYSRSLTGNHGEASWAIMATIMAECYNKGRRSNDNKFPSILTIGKNN